MKTIINFPFSILLLSFLLFAACTSFEPTNHKQQTDMAFTIIIPGGAIQLSGNPIWVNCATSTTDVDTHRLLLRITNTDDPVVIPGGPWVLEIEPDSTGEATFDIHAIVNTVFNYDIDNLCTAKVVEHDQLAADLSLEVGESYIDVDGDVVETWSEATPETIHVLKGSLPDAEFALLAENSKSFFTEFIQANKFLTRLPGTQRYSLGSYGKLWFIPSESKSMNITALAVYADLSSKTDVHTQTFSSDKLYEVNTKLSLWTNLTETNNGAKLVGLAFQLGDGTYTFGLQSYFIDNEYHENTNEFYFINPLSGADLVVCTGEFSELVKTEGETYTRPMPTTPALRYGNRINQRRSITRAFKCNTGFLSKTERIALSDMFATQNCWWKTDRYGIPTGKTFGLVPIIINPGSFELDTTSDDLKSIEFEFEIAYSN